MTSVSDRVRARIRPFAERAIALVIALAWASPSAAAVARDGPAQAEALYQNALRMLQRKSIEGRRVAIDDLERATLLAPRDAGYQLALARAYYQVGFLASARKRFERVLAISPNEAEGRYGLGQVWRRDWLKYLEPASLDRAVQHFTACCRLRPDHTDGWIMLVPLLIEQNNVRAAYDAAQRGLASDPRRPEALLAVAYAAFRAGEIERADSAFGAAIPRLPRSVRERFDDISPVATERDTITLHRLSARDQAEFVRRFWKDMDPDLATPVNEALLEFRARVAHAYFLFYNPKLREWDERGEVYVRYGAPDKIVYNPVGMNLNYTRVIDGNYTSGRLFPANVLVWDYPGLGMTVTLQDRTLNEYYMLPITMDHDPDPLPNADSLARRSDKLAARSGRGVFPLLPPGVRPLAVRAAIARFESGTRPQLLAQIEVRGSPVDSQWVEWAVLDSARREVARSSRTLSPSACDPSERRVADFAAELPPGAYLVGLTVRDAGGHRGVYRSEIELSQPGSELALSDVLVSCGAPFVGPGGAPNVLAVRPEPNPAASVGPGSPLTAYFEIYHLSPSSDGLARFQYVYTVKSAERDPRIWIQRAFAPRKVPDPISATRGEEQIGTLRRQFVSVPVQSLPPGKYRLEITVRDQVAGTEATRQAEFVKTAGGMN